MPQLRINVRVIVSCHMKCSKYRQFFFFGRCIYRQWRLLPWCCFKRKAVEDRTATNRKLSEQQQARCEGWAAATRDILEAHPGASMREYRNPRRLPASRQMWRQGQAVLPLHQSSGYPCRPIRQPVWQPRVGSVPSERRGTEAFGRDSEDCDQSEGWCMLAG